MKPKLPPFTLGVQYYRQPTPLPAEWPADLKAIKEMGFDTIQLRPHWRWHERNEGEFVWDDLDELFELARRNGLQVIFKFMLECAPDWVFENYAATRITPRGEAIEPTSHGAFYPGGWLPCFDRDDVRMAANPFIRTAVKRYRGHPNLLAWHLWNEPRSRPNGDCACGESTKKFQAWLKGRFNTIERLNAFGGVAYSGKGGDFSSVKPPVAASDYLAMLLWRHFRAEMVADRLQWVRAQILSEDDSKPLVAHAGFCSALQDPLEDVSQDYPNSRTTDIYGSSCPNRIEDMPMLSKQSWEYTSCIPDLICTRLRGLGKTYWMHEIYGNGCQSHPPLTPAYLRHTLWESVAGGVKGLVIWQYRSERVSNESNEAGLVEIDGTPTERSAATARVLQTISKNRDEFTAAKIPQAKVAVVYDFASDVMSRLEANPPVWVQHGSVGGRDDYPYKASLRGIHMAFWESGVRVDMVPSEELENISRYPAVYLVCPRLISEEQAAVLKRYVENGGVLISEPSPGLRSENGWQKPEITAPYLAPLFGARETYRELIPAPWKFKAGAQNIVCPAELFCTRIEPLPTATGVDKARVIARWKDGGGAIALRKLGKGTAVLLGAPLGEVHYRNHGQAVRTLLESLFGLGGVGLSENLAVAGSAVQVRTLTRPSGERLFFVFNYSEKKQRVTLRLGKRKRAAELTETGIKLKPEASGKLALELPPNEVVVLREES